VKGSDAYDRVGPGFTCILGNTLEETSGRSQKTTPRQVKDLGGKRDIGVGGRDRKSPLSRAKTACAVWDESANGVRDGPGKLVPG